VGQVLLWLPLGWFVAALALTAVLSVTNRVRRVRRSRGALAFPVTPPAAVQVGDSSVATVYTYGEDLYRDMLAAIASAADCVLLESFIFKSDAHGQAFKRALIAAADRGVSVFVIYDGFANLVVGSSFFRFRHPLVRVMRFPLFRMRFGLPRLRPWGRDHRKLLVVDNAVGFVGGYNIGALYATDWRDTHLKLEGPAVWEVKNAFVDFWNANGGMPALPDEGNPSWDPSVRAHRNVPSQLAFPIRSMYLESMDRARSHIQLTAAYFIPDSDILEGLKAAARRGVTVDILLPRVSNHAVPDWLSRGFFTELLEAGVRIHRYENWMVHAKTITIDDVWSSVGTANIDRLSLSWNYEINVEIHGAAFAKHLGEVFATDLRNARLLTRAEWDRRRRGAKACELLLRPLRLIL
jgi:cardiolipin synthase